MYDFVNTGRLRSHRSAFALPIRELISLLRHSWIPPHGTWASRAAARFYHFLAASTYLGFWWGIIIYLLVIANFQSLLVALDWKLIKWMLNKTLFRWRNKYQNHKNNTSGWYNSFQQWKSRWLGFTVAKIHADCEEEFWERASLSESKTHGERLRFNPADTHKRSYCKNPKNVS